MNHRPVFVLSGGRGPRGEAPDSSRFHEVVAAIGELGLRAERFGDVSSLAAALDTAPEGREPLAVFMPAGRALPDACLAIRSHARFAAVPAFGVAAEPDDISFVELFQSGGDDLLPPARLHVLRRLRPLMTRAPGEAPPRRGGTVIVAGRDRVWRSILGRTFWNGGLSVRFVDDPSRAAAEAGAEGVRLVVLAVDEAEGAATLVREARQGGHDAPWIFCAPPRELRYVVAALRGVERAVVTDAFAPPENVLFLANELGRPRGVDARASARLLFGTRVAFRVAGREVDEVGFTYNVSERGMYVRTAAPAEPGEEVWLELWPPRSERRVRLAGRVAWRRHLGPNDQATVPAGFGVELSSGLAGDMERWVGGYRAYAEGILGASAQPPRVVTSLAPEESWRSR